MRNFGSLIGALGRRTPPRSRTIAIMHIPKTAGTALKETVRRAVHPRRIVTGFDRSMFGDFTAFSTFAPALRGVVLEPATMAPAELVAGHLALSTLRTAEGAAETATTLREPRSRLLSHWLFWRGQTDDQLAPWGGWAERVRVARRPLAEFLAHPELACQTDNIVVRMLLWPDPLVPADGFVPRGADAAVVRRALERLDSFDFIDIIENPAYRANLEAWLGTRVGSRRLNETTSMPRALRSSLSREIEPAAGLIEERTRLDAVVWRAIAAERAPSSDTERLSRETFRSNTQRYAKLMGR